MTENQRYYAFLSMLKDVKTEDILELFDVIDYDKDGQLSRLDIIITLTEEVFNGQIKEFKDLASYNDYTFDLPTRFQLRNIRDLYPIFEYRNTILIQHAMKDKSTKFSLREQFREVINYEENVEKWTQSERKSPIGQLDK